MSKAKSFTSVRELESGRFQARYRPRNAQHAVRTFDTEDQAREWLAALSVVNADEQPIKRGRKPKSVAATQ